MKLTPTKERKILREQYLAEVAHIFVDKGEDVQKIKSNAIAFPVVSEQGNEYYVKIVVSVPTGSRDGDAFDAYELADAFVFHEKQKAIKKAKAEEKKKGK